MRIKIPNPDDPNLVGVKETNSHLILTLAKGGTLVAPKSRIVDWQLFIKEFNDNTRG